MNYDYIKDDKGKILNEICIITCVGKKHPESYKVYKGMKIPHFPIPAVMLYHSNYFKAMLNYARSVYNENNIFIHSAQFGFVELMKSLPYYNCTYNNPYDPVKNPCAEVEALKTMLANSTCERVRSLLGTKTPIVAIGGANYIKRSSEVFPQLVWLDQSITEINWRNDLKVNGLHYTEKAFQDQLEQAKAKNVKSRRKVK